MSEKSSTFVGMNDEMKLRLAYAEIARLKEEMASANRGQVDLVAHDQALRADFERQRAEDRQFLDNFIGFFTTDGYVVYKVYDDDELHPDQHRSACLTHIRRKFVESLEENHSLSMWFIDEIGRLFGIEHDCKKAGFTADQVLAERLKRSKPIMDRIKEKFDRFANSNYKGLGTLTKKALKYIKTEWSAMQTNLQDGNLELSNNLAEQMMRHIKMNLKNCLNIGSEDSALGYAFMFSVIESCNMNKLSPGWYIKELVSRLTAKPCSDEEKVALLPCFIQK